MNYLVYDSAGEIREIHTASRPKTVVPPEGCSVIAVDGGPYTFDAHYIDTETLTVQTRAPVEKLADWNRIKRKRDGMREAPITLDDGRTFDASQDSFALFADSIDEFDYLPADALDADGKLQWKMSNNDYTACTKSDLVAIRDELRRKRAQRAALLQVRAEQLAQDPPTIGELSDPEIWGL